MSRTKRILIPEQLWRDVVSMLKRRHDTANYLEPEEFDDDDHKGNYLRDFRRAERLIKEAEAHIPERMTMARRRRRNLILSLAEDQHGAAISPDDVVIREGSDNGCHVTAWIWVDFTDTVLDKNMKGERSCRG